MKQFYLFLASAVVVTVIVIALSAERSTPTLTVFMPTPGQGSDPLCISNRTSTDVEIPHGPTLHPGQSITASVVQDFDWGFTTPVDSSNRSDVDCLVIQ